MAEGLNKKEGQLNKEHLRKGAVILFLIVVFAGIFLAGGVKTYPDTESYLKLSPNREPGYALLLHTAAELFGGRGFFILGLLQNGLAAAAVFLTADYIASKFRQKAVLYLAVFCLLLPYVVTPFFASSGIILTNAMISEGVTLSLYNLYMLYLLKAVWEEEKKEKNLVIAVIFSFLLSITRGQMLVTLIAWLLTAVWIWLKAGERKKICKTVLVFVFVLLFRIGTVNSYNLFANGVYTGTAYGDVTILSNVIYVADEKAGEAIGDETLYGLFEEIYRIAEDGHMLYKDAPADFSEEASFYSDMHDDIKDFAIYPTLQNYAEQEEGITDYMEKVMRVDALAHSLTAELLPESFGAWFSHYVRNVAVGLIRTVAFVHPLLNIPAFFGYALLAAAGFWVYRKDKKSPAVKLLVLTALLTAGNTAAVAMTIMCLSRYMIYNMAFVYIAAILLLMEITEKWRIRGKENGL